MTKIKKTAFKELCYMLKSNIFEKKNMKLVLKIIIFRVKRPYHKLALSN